VNVHVHDPLAESAEAEHEYGVSLTPWAALPKSAAIVAAVSHKELLARPVSDYAAKLVDGGLYVDVKAKADRAAYTALGLRVWRL
jgi:UDP-N-acetyl-D-glucosamine/UDP-N-acetyl-D-galactosamine dehydrogenase